MCRSLDRFALLFRPAEFARRQRVPRRLVRIVEIERDGDTRRRCWSMLARGGVRPFRSTRPRARSHTTEERHTELPAEGERKRKREWKRGREES